MITLGTLITLLCAYLWYDHNQRADNEEADFNFFNENPTLRTCSIVITSIFTGFYIIFMCITYLP